MNPLLTHINHRPWPLPSQPWVMRMEWHDLLFLHWPVPAAWLRSFIPPGLEVQTFNGTAWLGVVPFLMKGTRPRFIPSIPTFSNFPELNVRTYVTAENKPGVWFFSLDAANPLAVRGARIGFHLPYFDARMRIHKQGDDTLHYSSHRTHRKAKEAQFIGRYHPIGPVYHTTPGSLDHWLTERYCLYSADKHDQIWRSDIHHAVWPLQRAEVDIDLNTMSHQLGFELPDSPPLAHFSQFQDVVAWLIHRVRT